MDCLSWGDSFRADSSSVWFFKRYLDESLVDNLHQQESHHVPVLLDKVFKVEDGRKLDGWTLSRERRGKGRFEELEELHGK